MGSLPVRKDRRVGQQCWAGKGIRSEQEGRTDRAGMFTYPVRVMVREYDALLCQLGNVLAPAGSVVGVNPRVVKTQIVLEDTDQVRFRRGSQGAEQDERPKGYQLWSMLHL